MLFRSIIWPKSVSPFDVHLLSLKGVGKTADKIYNNLEKSGIEVLYDDRENKSAGEKFADADLIGIPYRIVISERTLRKSCVEIKRREKQMAELVKISHLSQFLKSKIKD